MSEQEQWITTLRAIFDRASTDPEFRRLCLQDPVQAIKEVAGRNNIPTDAQIVRFVDTPKANAILLPPLDPAIAG